MQNDNKHKDQDDSDLILSGKKLKELIKKRQQEGNKNAGTSNLSKRSYRNTFWHWIAEHLDLIIIIIGGILLSARLFFPPKYYLNGNIMFPYDGSLPIPPTIDHKTALLQALGIAVITGVVFYTIRKLNIRKSDSILPERDNDLQGKTYKIDAPDICSLTGQTCEYYDLKQDICFYGKEGIKSWLSKKCPKTANV